MLLEDGDIARSARIDMIPLSSSGALECGGMETTLAASEPEEYPTDVTITLTPRAVTTTPVTTESLMVSEGLGCPG